MFGRVAQLVFTVTEFPGVDRVVLTLDGSTDLGGDGIGLGTPLRRDDFEEFKPPVVVNVRLESPVDNSVIDVSIDLG